jgi:hypothetical protein
VIHLDLNGIKAQAVQIINVQGQRVWNSAEISNQMHIGIGHLASGIYLMQIQTEYGLIAKRIVVQR